VYGVWSYFQSEWFHKGNVTIEKHFENLSLASQLSKIEVYRSRIRNPAEGGGVSYESALPREMNFEAWVYRLRGQVARAWFCGWVPPIEQEVEKLVLNPALVKR